MASMAGYTKLFNSILASTVWNEPMETRIVWITLLAMADKNGVAEGSVPGLAVFARIPVEATRTALERLSSPDEDSRSKESGGRRIEVIEGGWRLINHAKYRSKMGADERREYLRLKQRQYRSQHKSTNVNKVSDTDTRLTHAEAEADTKAKKKEKSAPPAPSLSSPSRDPFTKPDVTERAGRFIERYQVLYPEYRHGARYAVRPVRDYAAAVTLCETWPDDARLEKLAICFLTTDHKFAAEGSRTLPQFLALASWADGELAQWEKARQ